MIFGHAINARAPFRPGGIPVIRRHLADAFVGVVHLPLDVADAAEFVEKMVVGRVAGDALTQLLDDG